MTDDHPDKRTSDTQDCAAVGAVTAEVTAALVIIGDEILSGRTCDQNINYIANFLTKTGINLREVRVVPDDTQRIVEAIRALKRRVTYVITTGGIGPTHDDITADAVAEALNVEIDVDERALALMQPHYERRGLEITPSRLRMARIPKGATLIKNRISIAPGFMLENVLVLAGVPKIMHVMLDDAARYLKTGAPMLSRSIVLNTPEGDLADLFAEHQAAFQQIAMGSYPAFKDGRLSCELVMRSIDAQMLETAYDALLQKLRAAGIS